MSRSASERRGTTTLPALPVQESGSRRSRHPAVWRAAREEPLVAAEAKELDS